MISTSISGKAKIFRRDTQLNNGTIYPNYSTSIGKKKPDGSWENAYINLGFRRGTDIPNGTEIDIIHGFLTFDTTQKNGKTYVYWKLFVMDFEMPNNGGSGSLVPDYDEAFETDFDDTPF